jgi:uncharacterized protein YxjI
MSQYCPNCGTKLLIGGKFCPRCGTNVEKQTMQPIFTPQATTPSTDQFNTDVAVPTQQYCGSNIWYQDFYKIRKKTLTVGNKYWIEDLNGTVLGFCKQKLFKLKEDIRIYTDESESHELFCIKQEQIVNLWGNFAVIDSSTNTKLGFVKRNIISAFAKDTWEVYTTSKQMVGKVEETSSGNAFARKYGPGGRLIPAKMHLEMDGQILAEINQDLKIVGDIWNMNCQRVPSTFDRRVLLACIILMGMIERKHK